MSRPLAVAPADPVDAPTPPPAGGGASLFILLGASNVTLGLPWIVSGLRRGAPGPIRILAAHGHGRSYGRPSWAPFRTLPGIVECGLWPQLLRNRGAAAAAAPERAAPPKIYALLTDVGNDLLYGQHPDQILAWVGACCQRLREIGAQLTIGRLPRSSLERVGRWRYNAVRCLFFPGSQLTYPRMRNYLELLDAGLAELIDRYAARGFVPRPEWYGFDPIHILRRRRASAWTDILSLWEGSGELRAQWPGLRQGLAAWRAPAAERVVLGIHRSALQPVRQWADGAELWLY